MIEKEYDDVPDSYYDCHNREMKRRWLELRLSVDFITTLFGQL